MIRFRRRPFPKSVDGLVWNFNHLYLRQGEQHTEKTMADIPVAEKVVDNAPAPTSCRREDEVVSEAPIRGMDVDLSKPEGLDPSTIQNTDSAEMEKVTTIPKSPRIVASSLQVEEMKMDATSPVPPPDKDNRFSTTLEDKAGYTETASVTEQGTEGIDMVTGIPDTEEASSSNAEDGQLSDKEHRNTVAAVSDATEGSTQANTEISNQVDNDDSYPPTSNSYVAELSETIETIKSVLAQSMQSDTTTTHSILLTRDLESSLQQDTPSADDGLRIPEESNNGEKDEICSIPVTVETMVEGNAFSQPPTEVEIATNLSDPRDVDIAYAPIGVSGLRRRHRSFDAAYKTQVVEFAEHCSNRSAGKKFGVDEKRIREWRRQKDELASSQLGSKRARRTSLGNESQKTGSRTPKRNFDAAFKIAAIEFAENNSNRSTGREFGVDEKQVREWRKQKGKLEKLPPGKKRLSGAGRKPAYPGLEEKLVVWIEAQKASEIRLTRADIQAKAVELSRADDSSSRFTASHGWLDNFFRRRHVSLRH